MEPIEISKYKITSKVSISDLNTHEDFRSDKKTLSSSLRETRKKLGKLQDTLYAHGKYAVLVCLQGMDTAGKDSLIREVFKDFNARGVVVHSFKVPTDLERKHDYIWRHYIALPARGKFGVFNRTHYENVLVTRVHPGYIMAENLPGVHSTDDVNQAFWDRRFEQINNFEKTIAENGTLIYKFFLNLSKDEQKNRLIRRLNKPEKNWKFSPGDLDERELWDKYMFCYEDILNRTSKPHAPWYAIPADNKPAARLIVASILLQEISKYEDIREPDLDPEVKAKISEYKDRLQNE
ncbi:MAG: polyphosphate kinase 2 family protein [Bacteroidia bacterium]|nr:polyphosphate kinase 2 family protein [Bacteroidia bacterium]NNF30299.1 polyphosphate kinase 2 family protein [Flavobacteriaceae bacterium]MBT8276375.1 polyphosphate kinase 2 family protein [Bacteroidia bacterium]NNJ80974.1 polyphosphate kinase 2 family protein [Flavobacteriaceae bacterium]NNK53556.1 polyphosphate kinase 2 family protein [Flavobacteriaceae bacterium]